MNKAMKLYRFLTFLFTSIATGLAAAFIVLLIRPELLGEAVDSETGVQVSNLFQRGGPASYADAVAQAAPSVVNVFATRVTRERPHPLFEDPLFQRFFGDELNRPRYKRENSLGSGVIVDSNGYILTNNHVIRGASEIQVVLRDGRQFPARIVGTDPESDLAVLQAAGGDLPIATLGHSEKLRVGDVVMAIGNPFGVGQTVTLGIVSATGRNQLGLTDFENFIQTDAAINPGNSGGALINASGEVVGINTAIYQRAEGIGFAIPINHAKRIVKELIRFGKVRAGWLGASVQELTGDMREYFSLNPKLGTLISHIMKGSPADRAGLRSGDIILGLDGRDIASRLDYQERIGDYSIGSTVNLSILSAGVEKKLSLEVAPLPKDYVKRFTKLKLGLKVEDISRKSLRRYRLASRKGVLVTDVAPNGVGGQMGLQPGDIIRQINQNTVTDFKGFSKAVIEGRNRSSMLLLVQRGRNGYYVTIEL